MVHCLYFLWKIICVSGKTVWLDEKLDRLLRDLYSSEICWNLCWKDWKCRAKRDLVDCQSKFPVITGSVT